MTKALVVVDYTNDFVADDGKLTCGQPAQDIQYYISNLMTEFHGLDYPVIMTVDAHQEDDPYHPETKLFPPHNIVGSIGQHLYGTVYNTFETIKNQNKVFWINKRRYSAFNGTILSQLIQEYKITELHLVGVCTDICILHTAIDAYNLGIKVVIHKQGVASFNPIGHDWALTHFKNILGAIVVE